MIVSNSKSPLFGGLFVFVGDCEGRCGGISYCRRVERARFRLAEKLCGESVEGIAFCRKARDAKRRRWDFGEPFGKVGKRIHFAAERGERKAPSRLGRERVAAGESLRDFVLRRSCSGERKAARAKGKAISFCRRAVWIRYTALKISSGLINKNGVRCRSAGESLQAFSLAEKPGGQRLGGCKCQRGGSESNAPR